ncbi:MAG: pyridoxine 5'-phosphate synthase [Pseudomonadota bacterium]
MSKLRLGVNIDHVATVRNARGADYPDPLRAAKIAVAAGADGITAHLREDRRHIRDSDMDALKKELNVPLNFEMAATDEMLEIALRILPHACCLVPEKREERTTEGGLDILANESTLSDYVAKLNKAGIRVSLFIEADEAQIEAAKRIGAPVVELHTGAYCHALEMDDAKKASADLQRIQDAASHGAKLELEMHAGHGITFKSVKPIAMIPEFAELNIGHFLISEAVFIGLDAAVRQMRGLMNEARAQRAKIA